MSGQIDVREYSDHLRFTLSGDESLDFALRYWRRVGDDCGRKGMKKALIVSRLKGRLSSADMNQVGGRVSQYIRGFKIAFVSQESDDYGRQLADIIARRSGGDVREFRSANQAEGWLKR